jgi:hypothetical protein
MFSSNRARKGNGKPPGGRSSERERERQPRDYVPSAIGEGQTAQGGLSPPLQRKGHPPTEKRQTRTE